MGKGLISVTNNLVSAFEANQQTMVNELGRTTVRKVLFTNGLKIALVVQVPNFARKADCKGIMDTLVNFCGFSKKDAANYCGVAYSYGTKLLRQK